MRGHCVRSAAVNGTSALSAGDSAATQFPQLHRRLPPWGTCTKRPHLLHRTGTEGFVVMKKPWWWDGSPDPSGTARESRPPLNDNSRSLDSGSGSFSIHAAWGL